jgi:hypothetical protein
VHSRGLVVASLVALGTLTDCGSGGGSSGPIPLASFGSEFAKVFCRRIYTCCDVVERASESAWGPTETDCLAALTIELSSDVATLQAGIDAGRIVYHGEQARQCIDGAASLSCADYGVDFHLSAIPACSRISDGTVAPGGACTRLEECANGDCVVGACVTRGGPGDACSSPNGCETGLYCTFGAGTCAPFSGIGSACDENAACPNNTCVIPAAGGAGTCGPPTACNGP